MGLASFFGVKLIKGKFKVDDALDVSSVHGITGVVGSLCVGPSSQNPVFFCVSVCVAPTLNAAGQSRVMLSLW